MSLALLLIYRTVHASRRILRRRIVQVVTFRQYFQSRIPSCSCPSRSNRSTFPFAKNATPLYMPIFIPSSHEAARTPWLMIKRVLECAATKSRSFICSRRCRWLTLVGMCMFARLDAAGLASASHLASPDHLAAAVAVVVAVAVACSSRSVHRFAHALSSDQCYPAA